MQPIPTAVKDVSVFPYVQNAPIEVPPVIVNSEGTYSVGTLMTHIFYNLDLSGGERKGTLQVGASYFAQASTEDGKAFETHWLYCTSNGEKPTFGLTQNLLSIRETAPSAAGSEGPYVILAQLQNVNVGQDFRPPAIGTVELIGNARGQLIATRFGTPHLMGMRVEGGQRSSLLHVGMHRIVASGQRVDNDETIGYQGLVCVDADDPAVFLQDFPGKRAG